MADLEQLAVKRDRGYLVRLIALLALGIVASAFVFRAVTGEHATGCVASVFLGADSNAPAQPHSDPHN